MVDDPRTCVHIVCLSVFLLFGTGNINAAVDWDRVDSETIKVFYAGVASWEFLKGEDHGTGADVVNKMKKTCQECHVSSDGTYDIRSDQIIAGKLNKLKSGDSLEPQPLPGMPGFKDVSIQAAYDEENIYLRFQWKGSGASITDPSLENDGREDRISVQLANKIRSFRNYGCLMVCHDDQTDMPDNKGQEVNLYGYFSRKKGQVVAQEKLDGYLDKGQFIDLWTAAFVGNKVKAQDQYILQDRIEDKNNLSVQGNYENGKYTLAYTRKLDTGDTGDVVLVDGKPFSISVGIHDNKNKGRQHYTSFSVSIGLAAPADISAQKF